MGKDARAIIDPWRGYQPYKRQYDFHASKARWRLLAGGMGGGKTLPACREAIATALNYPKSLGLVVRKNATDLHWSTWRTFAEQLEIVMQGLPKGLVKVTGGSSPQQPAVVKFAPEVGGSEIAFGHAENPGSWLGREPDWVFVDEGAQLSEDMWTMITLRLRGTRNPQGRVTNKAGYSVSGPLRLWIASNPGPSQWIRANFCPPGVRGRPREGFETFHIDVFSNVALPDEILHETYGTMFIKGTARYEAFVAGDWGVFEGQVFDGYDPEVHLVPNLEGGSLKGKWIVEGWDFGRGERAETAVVWIAVDSDWRDPICVFHDEGFRNMAPAEIAPRIKAVRARYGIREMTCIGDPAGATRGAGGSYFAEYSRHGIYIGPCRVNQKQVTSLEQRDTPLLNLLARRMWLATDQGKVESPCIVFCRRCEMGVVEQMRLAEYADAVDNPNKDKPQRRKERAQDRLDALEYAIIGSGIGSPPSDEDRWSTFLARKPQSVGLGADDFLRAALGE